MKGKVILADQNFTEAQSHFEKARKAGQKTVKECAARGLHPHPAVLDDLLIENAIAGKRDLGRIEIPTELIVGTKNSSRSESFSADFMPLLPPSSEFGRKWIHLCAAHLGDEGIRDPIKCYEYMGLFYVEEGNKRVSVLKSYHSPSIPGYVTRILPARSGSDEVLAYYEFLDFYNASGIYQICFNRLGRLPRLLNLIGIEWDHQWTIENRSRFLRAYYHFYEAVQNKFKNEHRTISTPELLLDWLEIYPFSDLEEKNSAEIENTLENMRSEVLFEAKGKQLQILSEGGNEKNVISKVLSDKPSHLNIAFLHATDPRYSEWSMSHETGKDALEQAYGSKVEVRSYVARPDAANDIIQEIINNNTNLIFATAPSLIVACRHAAMENKKLRFMVCGNSLAYHGFSTYTLRIYEIKFITGAIAGVMSEGQDVGYIAKYPVYGAPAAINAFALGVRLTNPNAKVHLKWSCVPGNPTKELREKGIRVISNREDKIASNEYSSVNPGTYRIEPDGTIYPLASGVLCWGTVYEKIVSRIFEEGWNTKATEQGIAINMNWGMSSGALEVDVNPNLPSGVHQLTDILQTGIKSGTIDPFRSIIYDQEGTLRCNGDTDFQQEDLLTINWLCDNIIGDFPEFNDILPMDQDTVHYLGFCKDSFSLNMEKRNE